ncbi:MAG: PAS domain S-box protein [Desulforhopalus sp.]|nr:PAS domain S-box protein [Desulforhopalus sp.]
MNHFDSSNLSFDNLESLSSAEIRRKIEELQEYTRQLEIRNAELQKGEGKYRNLFETMSQGVVYQAADGRIISANPAAERILGLSLDQMLGKTSLDPDWKTVREDGSELPGSEHPSMVALRTGKPVHRKVFAVMNARRKQHTWISVNATPLFQPGDAKPFQVYVTFDDISAQRLAEQNYQTLFREMLNGFALHEIICNAAGKPVDYRFLDVNPAFEKITGLKRADLVGRTVLEVMPETEPHWIETYGRVALSGESVHFENAAAAIERFFEVTAFQPMSGQFACIFTDITKRRKNEEALRASEASLRAITDSAHDAILLMDPDGSITFWNPAAERIFGYRRQEVIGTDLHRLIAPERYHAAHKAGFAGFKHTGKGGAIDVTLELEARHKDGHEIAVELALSALHLQTGWHTVGIIRDVTERKMAEEKLRESEGRFRALHNASFGGIVIHDQGVILDCNQGFCEQTGYTMDELIGMDGLKLIAPLWRDLVRQNIRRGHDQPYDVEGLRKDGTCYPLTIRGKSTPYKGRTVRVTEFRDITERKATEKVLRETVARFKALFDATSDSVILIEPDGTILDLNENAARRRNIAPAAMLGKNLFGFLPAEAAASRREAVSRILAEKRLVHYEEVRNGRHYSIRLHPVMDGQGQVIQIASFSRDVTEHKRSEEEMVKLQAQLHQSQKMEAVGQLAGGVAHDFNNMLGVILGHTELAMEQVKEPSPLLSDLQEIRRAAQRSAEITRQLLAFARKQTVAPKILDLNETVEGMLKMLRRLIGEDINLMWLPGSGLWPVKIDPSQIDQILANLCVNARDAITGGGNIIVETGNSTFDEEYCAGHSGFVSGEYVRLTVSDNGSGMDEIVLVHIFEPFFTTKEVGEGTGLGLATVYGAVKQNGGFINVASEPGQGTAFTIYLPKYHGEIRQLPVVEGAEDALRGDETILLVEDESTILKMVTIMLELLGYTVLPVGTPGEALRLAGEHTGRIDLLLTDVIMPEMNGRDLAEALGKKWPGMQCLFMSGYTANVITLHGVLDDGVNFIQKPFSKNDLAGKVRQALGQFLS